MRHNSNGSKMESVAFDRTENSNLNGISNNSEYIFAKVEILNTLNLNTFFCKMQIYSNS